MTNQSKNEFKKFSTNGKVDPKYHFYVDPTPWNAEYLLPNLERGGFYSLLAPNQTGKTTKCIKLIEMIKKDDKFIPIWYFHTFIPKD